MERFTISLDTELAREFDRLILERGYRNRSEAIRDILRGQLEQLRQTKEQSRHCIANLSYIYNHHERDLAERLIGLQHDHHNLTVATMHAHLDHEHCIESAILRGPTAEVTRFADAIKAERGVRHGQLNLISADVDNRRAAIAHVHAHGNAHPYRHVHLKPKN
ncbi:MAG: nickel-responsive transcriptional regulator NikR [Betaproteobacteria bacterium]|nr:nickel-responsive transcriptional regulator NikR [Betaproteobacteria bacterium]